MPLLRNELRVVGRVHLNRHVTDNGRERGCCKNPGEEVPEASEEAADAAISRASCDRCPMIDTSRRWNC